MKVLLQGLILIGLFTAANVVAGGVVLLLGMILQKIAPGWESPWPWFLICGAAAIAAFLFLRGAMCYANGRPLLQWRARRRQG